MKSRSAAVMAAAMLFFAACNSGNKEVKTEAVTDTVAMVEPAPPPPPPPAKPANVLLIWHKVGNYAKWLTAYESHDSVRLANGLHNYVIGREMSDTNYVLVALKMDDAAKAKAFTSATDVRSRMKTAGVISTPVFIPLDIQMNDTSTNALTTRIMMTHKVKDVEKWKAEFDSHKQARMDAGMVDRALGYGFDNKNEVTVVFAVKDLEKAKAFLSSKDLKDKMAAAGVEGKPSVHIYTVSKKW